MTMVELLVQLRDRLQIFSKLFLTVMQRNPPASQFLHEVGLGKAGDFGPLS